MLAGIALITSVSLYRFVAFGIPTLLAGWYASNKQWLYTLLVRGDDLGRVLLDVREA